jgi:hypothetical protein
MRTRWRCTARDLAVAHGLDDTVTVLKAVYAKSTGGAAEPTWQVFRTGVRARIQPAATEATVEHQSRRTVKRHDIYVEEDLDLDRTHRIRAADGTVYGIITTRRAERIGELPVIEVEIVSSA